MIAIIQAARGYTRELKNKRILRPRSTLQTISFIVALVVFIVVVLWGEWWLPNVDIESARWALSAQAQASGAILGLLIAAMVFKWHIVANQEQELRNKIHLYFKRLADPSAGVQEGRFIVDVAYDEYLSWIRQQKGKVPKKTKAALITLGRFWVIKELSLRYSSAVDETLSRSLRYGQISDLLTVNKLSKNSATDMWDSYFTNPARFVLDMHDALQYVSRTLAIIRRYGKEAIVEGKIPWSPVKEYEILETVLGLMRSDDSWLVASEVARGRSAFKLPFYTSCVLLSTATILALTILTGLGGIESLLGQHPDILRYLIAVPIGFSIFGIYFCVLLVTAILR